LARTFRYFEKKRGHRRTGSKTLAIAGEVVFFTVFLVGGVAGLIVLYNTLLVPQWRANTEFVAHRCVVRDKHVGEKPSDDGPLYRPEIQIEYTLNDERFVIWTYDIWVFDHTGGFSPGKDDKLAILADYEIGREYRCWYDPDDPSRAVLVRTSRWWIGLIFILPISFVLMGAGRLVYLLFFVGKSAERRSAFAQKAAKLAPFDGNGRTTEEFPAIPAGGNLTDSPGTTLTYRLPVAASPSWATAAAIVTALIWNGLVAWLLVVAVRGFLRGRPDWLLTLFVIAFTAGGVLLLIHAARRVMVATGVGPTLLEVSQQPLRPGHPFQLFISQTGRLHLQKFEVRLVCEEEAAFRHGTNTRKESCCVLEETVLTREDFEVVRGTPYEVECEIQLPEHAMHSFKSAHNEIAWRFVVRGHLAGWPDYERSFPVLVYPNQSDNGTS